jgi:CDP-4-dehydro-6-deoxyglucose reductase, E3
MAISPPSAVAPPFEVRLRSARPLSPSVRELSFERVDGAPFAYEAGQWVSLALPLPEGELRRAYSIASPPDESPRFDLAVTHVTTGPGSTYLHGIEPGTVLRAYGPQGFFTRPLEGAPPALFVGTGTGVAPLRSMLRNALARGHEAPLSLLFGVRNREEILYRDELEAIGHEHPRVKIHVTLSRPDESWEGRRGYVQLHVRELYEELVATGLGAPQVFVCGLERMVGSVRELLRKGMGLPRACVHTERYDTKAPGA